MRRPAVGRKRNERQSPKQRELPDPPTIPVRQLLQRRMRLIDRPLTTFGGRSYTPGMRLPRFSPGLSFGLMVAVVACALTGCSIFDRDTTLTQQSDKSLLPPIQTPADAIHLEIMYVERPISDPLLGRGLWEEMDQLAGIPAETRLNLLENGFRVGLAGTEPPPTLSTLLNGGDPEEYDEVAGIWTNRRVALRTGAETDVHCSHAVGDWKIAVSRDGISTDRTYEQALGVIRVKLDDIEDGWVKLHLTPEVHHGVERMRREASDGQWNLSSSKDIDTVGTRGFSVHLSLNEMLVLSADDAARNRAGNHFFRREEDGRLMQRVIVIRVADLTHVQLASR